MSGTASAPATAVAGVKFTLTGGATLRNNGPTMPVLVDTTFSPVLPSGCTATTGVFTAQDTPLIGNLTTSISHAWSITCALPGTYQFTMNVSAVIDPLQLKTDPNPANNSGSGTATVQVN
jgi:hypothetical protein